MASKSWAVEGRRGTEQGVQRGEGRSRGHVAREGWGVRDTDILQGENYSRFLVSPV